MRCGSECMTGGRWGVGQCGEGDGSALDRLAVFWVGEGRERVLARCVFLLEHAADLMTIGDPIFNDAPLF